MSETAPSSPVRHSGPVTIGFDLGGTKMLAVVFDEKMKPIGRKRRKTRGGSDKQSVRLERLAETVEQALEDAGADVSQLMGIGAGVPGPLDLEKGVILEAPNLGWKNINLRRFLSEKFHCPAVICNDVDAGVFGEYTAGVAQGERCVLGVFPGTGIGGGCVYEGHIFRGRRASCMEVGFLQMATEGATAGIGLVGTLEGLASRLAIAAEAAKAVYRGQAPNLRQLAGTDLASIRSSALAKSIELGDTVIEEIVRRAAEQVGRGIGSLINILAPDMVVLGGGLVEAMPKLYMESVRLGIRRNVLPSLADVARVRVSELGDLAAATGAAALVRQFIAEKGASQQKS
ncbi:MAG: ROK family protein [Planctomycetaceae bacterium]|nr:ROK family protein [Planctomycetaceae bacterium]